jgi:hypothetical protein
MPLYQSYIGSAAGIKIPLDKKKDYHLPDSANAALAEITLCGCISMPKVQINRIAAKTLPDI